ncbi:MAG: polyisoprenoid-binding protein YceI [Glaciecola sp.]|jgi:polyisoprenoid-binding protein YceI
MRTNFLKFLTILAIGAAVVSCKKKADEAVTTDAAEVATSEVAATKYMANATESVIEWTGYKPTGKHNGTIKIETGVFTVNDGTLETGSFIIDMNSLSDSEANAKLEGHLKSADFFDVEKHASAAFEVTGFEMVDGKSMLSGNLTLKDVKNNVTFPVTTTEDGDTFTLTSEMFTIDRSKWNVQYGSKSFFDDLGDKFINDDIELKVTVKAKKS